MTIVTTVQCDGFGCSNETEVESTMHSDISGEGYHEDPNQERVHYCDDCWPEVLGEIEEEEADD